MSDSQTMPEGKKAFKVTWYEMHELQVTVIADESSTEDELLHYAMNESDTHVEGSRSDEYHRTMDEFSVEKGNA